MMTTYWDLTEAERAALSQEDVQRYVDAELMLKGVLKVRPLVLEDEPAMPEPKTVLFVVQAKGRYNNFDPIAAFTTRDAAEAYVRLAPMRIAEEYVASGADNIDVVRPVEGLQVVQKAVFSEAEKDGLNAEIKRAAAVRATNKQRADEYGRAVRAQEEALKGLWEDWATVREKFAKLREVAVTFADYERTAGDPELAAKFLAKVYDEELIAEADAELRFLPKVEAAQ